MSVSKDPKNGTWTMYTRYKDWQGIIREKRKRGFKTKREALEYERQFLLKNSKDIQMSFEKFVETYMENMKPRLKYSTYVNKEYIIRDKILPYFGNKSLAEITSTDVIQWQNALLSMRDENDRPYSQTYLRAIQNQLSAIMNHACRYYGLPENPCMKSGKMGKAKSKEMLFWTKEEYLAFSQAMKEKPVSYYAFEILYWCGIREGELLALTRGDIDLEKRRLRTDNLSGQCLGTLPPERQRLESGTGVLHALTGLAPAHKLCRATVCPPSPASMRRVYDLSPRLGYRSHKGHPGEDHRAPHRQHVRQATGHHH